MREFEISRDKIRLTGLDSKHVTLIVWLIFASVVLAGMGFAIWMLQPAKQGEVPNDASQLSVSALDERPIWAWVRTASELGDVDAIAHGVEPCSS
jgi:hypothetical protein